MPYIHELSNWPHFEWDLEALAETLSRVNQKQGLILGAVQNLGFELRAETSLRTLTEEVITTSAIEGGNFNAEEVRSSVAKRLGLDFNNLTPPNRQVDGIVEVLVDATENYNEPLTAERLFRWHAALFPTGRDHRGYHLSVGEWRTDTEGPMQVVSGGLGDAEKVHYCAPAAQRLKKEMAEFITWFNSPPKGNPVIKAALAHFWFVSIHPFDDGNGRIARAIADMALAQSDHSAQRFYCMSAAIQAELSGYYTQLECSQSGSMDITSWLGWFLECLNRALDKAEDKLQAVLLKVRIWNILNAFPVNHRQKTVINRMLDNWQGNMTNKKYVTLTKTSPITARRDMASLVEWGILIANDGKGRSTSYRLTSPDTAEITPH